MRFSYSEAYVDSDGYLVIKMIKLLSDGNTMESELILNSMELSSIERAYRGKLITKM